MSKPFVSIGDAFDDDLKEHRRKKKHRKTDRPGEDSADDFQVLVVESAEETGEVVVQEPAHGDAPPEPPEPPRSVQHRIDRPARAGMPDVGGRHDHLVVQGIVTYKIEDPDSALTPTMECILPPWQMLPYSEGYEFVGANYDIRFHRGVYRVNMNGEPSPAGSNPRIAMAGGSFNYVTYADSICGFSGARYRKSGISLERLIHIRDNMTRQQPNDQTWAAIPENQMPGMEEVLPRFMVEYVESAETDYAPIENLFDMGSGKWVKVVELKDHHLLAPIPGIPSNVHEVCVHNHGFRFMLNRIWIAGTGLRPTGLDVMKTSPLLASSIEAINSSVKLQSVLLPCVNQPAGKIEGGIHDLFCNPSAPALRNLLGSQVAVGGSVLA